MERLKVGLLYISLHSQLKKNVGIDRCIQKKKVFCILGKHFLIPKNLRVVVIKEMENLNLIKQESGERIVILDCDIDLENDPSKLYRVCGLY
jgi:hypothetical protein